MSAIDLRNPACRYLHFLVLPKGENEDRHESTNTPSAAIHQMCQINAKR